MCSWFRFLGSSLAGAVFIGVEPLLLIAGMRVGCMDIKTDNLLKCVLCQILSAFAFGCYQAT